MDMDYDGLSAWLRERLGRRVMVAVQADGNSGLSVVGPLLRRDDGEVTLVEPRPGRVEAWSIGGATLLLLEGDFVSCRGAELETGAAPMLVQAEFHALVVTVGEVPPGASL
jgi:hypothetical protein